MPPARAPVAYDDDHPLAEAFRAFVRRENFPCVGAKSALGKGQMRFIVARDIASSWDDLRLYAAVAGFAAGYKARRTLFQSLIVLFDEPGALGRGPMAEARFERHLWKRIQSLSDKDDWHGHGHDARVSADASSPHFSLSFAGEAFFIVGLHPAASRPARRFERPAMVFNLHDQFEELRRTRRFDGLQETIARRDVALAGSVNPMLQPFGQASEARQYSGRAVGVDWACPFRRGGADDRAA